MASKAPLATAAKRKREDKEMESDNTGGDDRKKAPLTKEQLEEITLLKSHTARFEFETIKMPVDTLLLWHQTNLLDTKLVFDTKYQRNQNAGWDSEKESQYLASIMAGQAATPFVANKVRKQARLMDGGHRLQAIVKFRKDEIPMAVKGSEVYYSQMPEEDQQHFISRKLQVMEFNDLPFKDEVDYYIKLNSGLPLSFGERLHSTTSCNPVTKVADLIVKEPLAEESVQTLCRMLGKTRSLESEDKGRKNELLALTFFVFNMYFRTRQDTVNFTIGDTFLQDVCKLNKEVEWRDSQMHNDMTMVDIKDKAVKQLERTLDLCRTVERPKGQTEFRCVVTCMLAVREIEENQLRAEFLSSLMAGNTQLKIFAERTRMIKVEDIQEFVQAYGRLLPDNA